MKFLTWSGLFFTLLILISVSGGHCQTSYDLFDYERTDREASIVARNNFDSLTRVEKIVLDAFYYKVPFYHFLNERNPSKPYVILLHGLGGEKSFWINPGMPYLQFTENLTAIKDSLLALGFSIIIIDAKFHGERSYELNFRDPGTLPPVFSKNQADAELFHELYVYTIREVRLIMDYLDKRYKNLTLAFNLVGYSMGGAFALILNTVDDRINSVVACVPPIARPYSELEDFDWPSEVEKKMKEISPLYCATDQKSAVLMLMGNKDHFIPEEEARRFYELIPISDKKIKFYNSGHELPTEFVKDVINWIVIQTESSMKPGI